MLIFHEGLPRSGKSYEAMTKHVIPSIRKSRHVYARIDGMDHDKIAAVSDLSVEHVREYLHELKPDQVEDWQDHVTDRSLVVLDELQNYFPAGRQKPAPDRIRALAEHGHREIDILAMGQDLKDVHALWRRRVDRKIQFVKRDVLGRPGDYTWRTQKQVSPDRWEEISSGKGTYDKAFFGIYKSHTTDSPEGEDYKDSRAVIWNNPKLKFGIPLAAIAGIWGITTAWAFFHPETGTSSPVTSPQPAIVSEANNARLSRAPFPVAPEPEPIQRAEVADPVLSVLDRTRPRLAAIIQAKNRVAGLVHFMDGSFRTVEALSFDQLRALGWTIWVDTTGTMVILKRADREFVATAWPIEVVGRVSAQTNEAIREQAGGSAASSDRVPRPIPELPS